MTGWRTGPVKTAALMSVAHESDKATAAELVKLSNMKLIE
jgi:hypothetical protein